MTSITAFIMWLLACFIVVRVAIAMPPREESYRDRLRRDGNSVEGL